MVKHALGRGKEEARGKGILCNWISLGLKKRFGDV